MRSLLIGLLVASLWPAMAPAGEATRTWTTPFTEQVVNQEVAVDELTRTPRLPMVREPDSRSAELWYGQTLHRVGSDVERDTRLTLFAVEYRDRHAERVWFDANRNGDLTDDPALPLYGHASDPEARCFITDLVWVRPHQGVELPVTRRLRVVLGPLDGGSASRCRAQNVFGRAARIELGARTLRALLMDGNADGLYTEDFADGVFVDLDQDGGLSIDLMSLEFGPFSVPFEMEGRLYRCRPLDPRGEVLEWTDLGPAPERGVVATGAIAPEFTFTDSSGHVLRLSDWRGRWVVVQFWASWCSACVDQAPDLRELYEERHSRGFEMVGVSYDAVPEEATAFRRRAGHTWPTRITGRRYWEEPVGRLYQANGAGLLFLVDPAGRVHGRYTDAAELAQVLRRVMTGSSQAGARVGAPTRSRHP